MAMACSKLPIMTSKKKKQLHIQVGYMALCSLTQSYIAISQFLWLYSNFAISFLVMSWPVLQFLSSSCHHQLTWFCLFLQIALLPPRITPKLLPGASDSWLDIHFGFWRTRYQAFTIQIRLEHLDFFFIWRV